MGFISGSRMKLAPFFICLSQVAEGANYSKCPSIEVDANEKEKGPKCVDDNCIRRCNDGFTPAEPFMVFCFKKPNGKFKWVDENLETAELGACVSDGATDGTDTSDTGTDGTDTTENDFGDCKAIELKNGQIKSGMEVNCKINGKGQTVCNMECPAGMTVNGKDGVTKKKLICKCGSKCKWK